MCAMCVCKSSLWKCSNVEKRVCCLSTGVGAALHSFNLIKMCIHISRSGCDVFSFFSRFWFRCWLAGTAFGYCSSVLIKMSPMRIFKHVPHTHERTYNACTHSQHMCMHIRYERSRKGCRRIRWDNEKMKTRAYCSDSLGNTDPHISTASLDRLVHVHFLSFSNAFSTHGIRRMKCVRVLDNDLELGKKDGAMHNVRSTKHYLKETNTTQ